VATLARDKFAMRQAFVAGGVPCPRFALATGIDEALRVGADFGYPVVLKPALGSGSQFVRRIDDPSGMAEHFPRLHAVAWDAFSLDPLRGSRAAYGDGLLIESYIDGGEVSVESVIVRGQTEVLAIHDKPLPMTGPLFEEVLATTPSRLPASTQQRLRECTERAHAALRIATGATHAEFRVTPGGMPVALEVAARIGGGAVYQSVRHSVGVDMVEAAIDLACGQRPVLTRHDPRPVAELALFAGQEGVLESVSGAEEAAADPAVLEIQFYQQPGDQILASPRVQQPHGHILFTAASTAELDQTAKRLGDLVRFRVRSPCLWLMAYGDVMIVTEVASRWLSRPMRLDLASTSSSLRNRVRPGRSSKCSTPCDQITPHFMRKIARVSGCSRSTNPSRRHFTIMRLSPASRFS
jgi:biotin carboxylase